MKELSAYRKEIEASAPVEPLRRDFRQVRIIRPRPREQHNVVCGTIKTIAKPIGNVFVRKVTEARENSLLQFPGVTVASFQHVTTVVGFYENGSASTQLLGNQRCDVTEVHQRGYLDTRVCGGESKIIDRVVGNGKWVEIDLPNPEILARLDLLHPVIQR